MQILDPYEVKARWIPALITVAPLLLVLFVLFDAEMERLVSIGSTIGAGSIFVVLGAQIVRAQGLKTQEKLLESWGNMPSVVVLRHRDNTIDQVSKERYHKTLSRCTGRPLPTPEHEAANPQDADEVYWSCSKYLNKHTKSGDQHVQVRAENANYGFRRNMLGMKFWGTAAAIASVGVVIAFLWFGFQSSNTGNHVMFVFGAFISGAFFIMCVVLVTPRWVEESAFRYATSLIEACDLLECQERS